MWLELPVLPAGLVAPINQVYKITNLLLWSTNTFASMVLEARGVAAHMLLHPNLVIAVVFREEIGQFGFRVFWCAEKTVLAVLPALASLQHDAPTCIL